MPSADAEHSHPQEPIKHLYECSSSLSLPLPDVPYLLAGCATPLTKVSSPDSTPDPTCCLTEDSSPYPPPPLHHLKELLLYSVYRSQENQLTDCCGDIFLRVKVRLCDVGLRVIIKTIKRWFSSTRQEMMIPHSSESTLRRESEQT